MDKLKTTMQMEMDAKMAEQQWEIRQQNELMEQILIELKNKQLVVGDKDIFDANRRETVKFGRRTGMTHTLFMEKRGKFYVIWYNFCKYQLRRRA